jgi:(5-formylfuran-3-yl)methyl phosphate synthase
VKLLVSVRSVEEALLAAQCGVDFIDLKEPGAGALGGLPIATLRSIVDALRRQGIGLPISATIGDVPLCELARIAACVDAVGACGVDYVKVGIERTPQALAVLDMLAACGKPVVPVFIADQGLEFAHVQHACALGFPGVMADTADKRAGSLFDAVPMAEVRRFITTVRAAGAMVGLAGALRIEHRTLLSELAPDFAGFRTAVCVGDRSSTLDPRRLRELSDICLP